MRLASVADRVGKGFVRPLAIDRVSGLVRPAMEDAAAEKRACTSHSHSEGQCRPASCSATQRGGGGGAVERCLVRLM